MAQILSQGYEAQRLTQSFHELSRLLGLDVLLIDTHPGLNEEALLTMRAVETLIVVLRPDAQDFEGTGVTVQVARQLEVPAPLAPSSSPRRCWAGSGPRASCCCRPPSPRSPSRTRCRA